MALSSQQIAQLWVDQGGDPKYARLMANIAKRESGGHPKINNAGLNRNGTTDWGLYQVNDVWRRDPVIGPMFKSGEILTPEGATKAAIRILKQQGPTAWATYKPNVDERYLGGFKANPTAPSVGSTAAQPAAVGGDRSTILQQYLAQRGKPGALAGLAGALGGGPTQPAAPDRASLGEALGSTALNEYAQRASAIDAKRLPYLWGGGHGGKVDAYKATPLDCSGAVSAVLGIDPRVSGQFAKWGRPGTGDGKGVVVYSNPTHVLMSIGGKFFGTSRSNPGGGAGWIPRSQISPDYLKNFTARHL